MKLKLVFIALNFLVLGAVNSCESEEEEQNATREVAYVTSVDAPSTGTVGEIITFEVKFQVLNGCGQFGAFKEIQNGNTTTVEVEAEYIGEICTQALEIRTTEYSFTPAAAGNYLFRFRSSPTDFIDVNLTVN